MLQNLLFPSTTMHLIDKGFNSQELPSPEVFRLDSEELYKGNLDLTALDAIVRQDKDAIAFVCIEVSNNAAGGCPISSLHLRELKSLLTKLSIPLVIDATRILENAQFFIERDAKFADRDLWAVAREILSSADAVIGSLTKDFCVNRGGIIATNDTALFKRVEKLAEEECAGIDVIERKQIALSLASRRQIEKQVLGRMECCRMIWHSLYECGVPVAQPVGGHCILIDVKQITDFAGLAHPVVSFLAWLYLNTGIRGGAHSVGMQQHTAINGMVRLAVPVGLTRIEAESVIGKLVGAFERKVNIPELALESQTPQPFGAVNANYKLIRYHKLDKNTLDEGARICTAVPAVSPRVPGPANFFPSAIAHQVGDIAIVGMAGRYPKAANTRELWRNLVLGMDCVEEIPQSRYELNSQCRFNEKYRGGFIDSVDRFDAQFFKVPENEAEMLDPQERLFLEVAWEALEDGGYYPETLAGDDGARNIGVYVGAVWSMYQMLGFEDSQAVRRIAPNSFHWSIANRVSYWMNLCGPSLTLDTACSSSLTAVCLAVESIRSGECCAAIVGGVNLDLHPAKHEINLAAGILSSDGVCRSFGKGANGYVAGEGVGALLLKPLDKSIRDNDNIYGVIRSAVVNHGGRTAGYTIPNPKAESQLIRSAIEKAGIDARSIGYIEAHGTGTQMGDAIEIAGLEDAFHPYGVDKQSCAIGTVKTNIGHLEAAAGVVGISKVLLQMKHRQLVPSLHANEPNELIDFANSSFYVVQQLSGWEARQVDGILQPLRAGVSCFGAGGTNAHIILDSYERVGRRERAVVKQQELIYPLSARSEEQLRMLALRLADFLEESEVEMRDIAYTLQVGRKSFDHRIAIVASTKEYLREKLMSFASVGDAEGVLKGQAKNERGLTGLLDSKEKEELARILSQRRDPHGLATLWVHGLLADWQARLDQTSARKVSIPTYPFVGKRYWVTREAAAGIAEKVAAGDECESPQGLPATQESQLQFNASDARGGGIAELTSVSLDGKMTLFLKQHAALQLNLQLGEIAADAGYFELGYSSIEIANLLQCLNELLGENLSVGELLGYPDIRSLAAYLTSVYPEKVAAIQVVKTTDVTSSPHSDSHPKSAMVNGVGSELLDKLQWHNAIPNESYEMVTF
ncbi:MAG: beta-ketoacyl synthase N-terminal-like domain-containing protein [Terracidiphilus sp.]